MTTYEDAKQEHDTALAALIQVDFSDTGMSRLAALEVLRTTLHAQIDGRINDVEATLIATARGRVSA